jgi:hypothetical protein
MNAEVYWTAVTVVVLAMVGVAMLDISLWLRGVPTVTTYLREHPAYFWWPILGLVEIMLIVAFHIFKDL